VLVFLFAANYQAQPTSARDSSCETQAVSTKYKERAQQVQLEAQLLKISLSSTARARADGESYVDYFVNDIFDGIYTDHTEDNLPKKYKMTLVAAVIFENATGVAAGYWLDGSTLMLILVTKAVNTGGPSGTSRNAADIADLYMKGKQGDLETLLEDEKYLSSSWASERADVLTCSLFD